jgi:hypothetical protein
MEIMEGVFPRELGDSLRVCGERKLQQLETDHIFGVIVEVVWWFEMESGSSYRANSH